MPQTWEFDLGRLIEDAGWAGLLVLGEDGREPDLCRWTRGRHLGLNLVWMGAGDDPRLVYFTDMERAEADATGIENYGPRDLDLVALRSETASTGEFLARAVLRLWRELDISPGPVGIGGRLAAGDTADLIRVLGDRGWQPVSGRKLLRSWRRHKVAFEIDDAREAAQVTREAFSLVSERLRRDGVAGVMTGELRRMVGAHFAAHGMEQPHGNIVAAGTAAAVPHTAGDDDQRIETGQTLVVDLYPRGLVYADCTRTFCIPPIPPAVAEAHAAVRASVAAAHEVAGPGVQIIRVVGEALAPIEDAGYPTLRMDRSTRRGMVHSLGHGLGYELHELPNLRPNGPGNLEVGDLVTVEPGLYDPEAGWGIRLEDMLLVGEEGMENLTPLPYDLDPAAWVEVE